jgi:protein-tyrosine-phosphatase
VAVRELYGHDLLQGYVPRPISDADKQHADLILVMAKNLLHRDMLPAGKTYLFREFFGSEGDVEDPWPDGRDQTTLERYRRCAEELRSILDAGLPRLVRALGS